MSRSWHDWLKKLPAQNALVVDWRVVADRAAPNTLFTRPLLDILKRLDNAKKELEYGTEDNFDHVLTNAVLEESFAGLCKLLEDNWFPHLKGAVDKGDGYGPEDSEDEGEEEEEEGKGGEEKE